MSRRSNTPPGRTILARQPSGRQPRFAGRGPRAAGVAPRPSAGPRRGGPPIGWAAGPWVGPSQLFRTVEPQKPKAARPAALPVQWQNHSGFGQPTRTAPANILRRPVCSTVLAAAAGTGANVRLVRQTAAGRDSHVGPIPRRRAKVPLHRHRVGPAWAPPGGAAGGSGPPPGPGDHAAPDIPGLKRRLRNYLL